MILIHSDNASGTVTVPGGLIEGEHRPHARVYQVEAHFVQVDGRGDSSLAAHDAREVCKIAGYRLATPAEQNAYHAARSVQTSLHETTPPVVSAPINAHVPAVKHEQPAKKKEQR